MNTHFSAATGGAQYQAEMLVNELVKTGDFEVFYLTRNVDEIFIPKGYKVIQIPTPSFLRRFGLFTDGPWISRILSNINPDVVYQRWLTSYTGYAANYANKNSKRFVFHIASDFDAIPYNELKKVSDFNISLIEKKIGEYGLKKSEIILAQTGVQSNLLEKNYSIRTAAVIKNFHPLPNELIDKSGTLKVIWVANFKPVKRPEMFVKLARDLQNINNVEFIMVGRAGNPDLYSSLHKEIESVNNLKFLGEQTQEYVNKLISKSHVFVNTSVFEGFPNTFIQAWMRKVPVVTAGVNSDGLFDDATIGFCGSTYEQMKGYVIQLIQDESLRTEIGEHAQRYAFKEHSIKNAEKLISVLRGGN